MKNAYNVLEEKREGKRPLGKSSRRSEADINTDLNQPCYTHKGVNSIKLAQDRVEL
jgi:hypothetical protein